MKLLVRCDDNQCFALFREQKRVVVRHQEIVPIRHPDDERLEGSRASCFSNCVKCHGKRMLQMIILCN